MNNPGFEFEKVCREYQNQSVLSEISFTLKAGQHTALIGPSGSGKSTVLRLLAGLETPSAGRVLLDGAVASTADSVLLPPHCRRVAMVFQDLALWPNLSVMQNVLFGLQYRGLPKPEVLDRTRRALDLCGISSLADRLPGTLSGGQQQRVALVRGIATRPDFLLLDEPFSGLDLVTKHQILKDIAALAEEQAFTLLLVTHDPFESLALCQRAIVLEQGQIIESGELSWLLDSPRSETLKVFREQLGGKKLF